MTRQLRPSDIKDATEWYTGLKVGGFDQQPRTVAARRLYWTCLRTLGLSYPEIEVAVGRDHSTILAALKNHRSPKAQVKDVMERANAQVRAESAVQLSMEER